MTIKHSISKIQWAIVWALNYYVIELSWVPKQLPAEFQTVETRCGREGHTRPRGPSESPDGVEPNTRRTRKTQRDGHNSGVKIWSLCSVSSTLFPGKPLNNPFQTIQIKWEVKILLKKSSCVILPSVFLCASVSIIESLWYGKWVHNTSKPRQLRNYKALRSSLHLYTLLLYRIPECSIRSKSFALCEWQS